MAVTAAFLPIGLHPSVSIPNPRRRNRRRCHCCLSIDRADEAHSASAGNSNRIVFAGGGTGGHAFAAVAIADEIKNADPNATFLFLGSNSGIEKQAVDDAGYDFASIAAVAPSPTSLLSPDAVLFPFYFLGAVLESSRRLREFSPLIVVGTGGYVSAPVCVAAVIAGIDFVIQEQNSSASFANRALAPFAKRIFVAFNACVKCFPEEKCIVTGNPVRSSLRRSVSKVVARCHFFPRLEAQVSGKEPQVVLVLGGSAGAHVINIAVLNMYSDMLQQHKNRYIIWQTGQDGFCEMESLVKNRKRVFLTPFLNTMDLAYAAADVVICRPGAMTCTEILLAGKPCILIPGSSPIGGDDYQPRNGCIMAEIAGAKILMENELESIALQDKIDEVLGNEQLMAEMSEKSLSMARPNATRDIAKEILSIVKTTK